VKRLVGKPPLFVLHADDDRADASLVKTALSQNQISANLLQVSDGGEILRYLHERSSHSADLVCPDLILLDLYMPTMDGRRCLSALKEDEVLRSIPVVILSTSDVESDVVACYELGAAGYITKPLDVQQYILKIQQIFDYWIGLVLLPKNPC